MSPFSDEQLDLYNACSQSYRTEANRRRTALIVDLAFAGIAAAIAAMTVTDASQWALDLLTTWSPFVTLLWLVIRETALLGDDREHRRTAVMIQEQFDLSFWKSDNWRQVWNQLLCGDPIQPRTIKDLSLRYGGETIADNYWVNATGVPPNEAALLRIQQSAGWGAKGHARYAQLNRAAVIVGFILVVTAAAIIDLGTRDIAAVLMAVAPLLVGRLQSERANAALTRRRETLERHIRELLSTPPSATERDVRAAQDELCRMRLENRRIPTPLYNRYADRDREAIDAAVARDAELLRSMYQAVDKIPDRSQGC